MPSKLSRYDLEQNRDRRIWRGRVTHTVEGERCVHYLGRFPSREEAAAAEDRVRSAWATGDDFCGRAPRVESEPGYERGEALGCPDCATGEPHVCPFLMADRWPEPRRSWALDHMRAELD